MCNSGIIIDIKKIYLNKKPKFSLSEEYIF